MTNIMIMAGGTGGHVFPALAVADVLRQRGVNVAWMGTARGIEARLVPEAGYTLNLISVKGLRGNGLIGWLTAPFKLVTAVLEAMAALKSHQSDIVLGLGGFASGPGGVAAWLLRKPLIVHEQNAIPGLTNRVLAKLARRVLQGFPNSFTQAEWVGNPVRASIAALSEPTEKANKAQTKLLILGGSLGAKSLNRLLPEALYIVGEQHDFLVKHQCGQKHFEACQQTYKQAGVEAEVDPFIADMATAYEWADIVVCRAGALTIAELSAVGVASVLVPYPFAVDDHQTHNAAALVDVGAAILMPEKKLTAKALAEQLVLLTAESETLFAMAKAARTQAKPEAAETIADVCMTVNHE
ncbi:MAG: UDP-N-acetylglucosamine--N-acetylmuramyl-(pentapeptide) pyrophosphoryl-undecaprenol N-acetylglucosamine transferase [Methylophagaceae bacterium]|jgi:UDP-N-acetylglucosamine--N-acetylmuramyl-(pentapeptide) pyrophosphoryl-undecaprenol N-acetylglucosamine transferase